MNNRLVCPNLVSIASSLPGNCLTTDELLEASGSHLSPKLRDMVCRLGINKRYSVLNNYPEVLFYGADPELSIPGSKLAVEAARNCCEKGNVKLEEIGLVLGVTSTPSRLLPSLVCDLFELMPELSRDAANLSIEYMGCSAVAKVVDVAAWYLTCNPNKYILVSFMEAITPLSPPLPKKYGHFSEVALEDRHETVDAMHAFLFADASVAMVLSAEGDGLKFGPVKHWTNDLPEDAELGTVPDGGSDIPVVVGPRRKYTLSPDVTPRGTFYAKHTVENLLNSGSSSLKSTADAKVLLMHTGSKRILNGLCDEFEVSPDSSAVASSYRILSDYANTLGCSVPLMLTENIDEGGEGIIVAFGLSFSCGACSFVVPKEGWRP